MMKELKLENPDNLEVTVALVKPRNMLIPINIITMAVYCPPRSRKKSKLIEFISSNYHNLKTKYPDAFFLCGGDINDLKWSDIEDLSPNLRQVVNKPTRQGKTLAIIITDLHHFYQDVRVLPPLQPDVEGVGIPRRTV